MLPQNLDMSTIQMHLTKLIYRTLDYAKPGFRTKSPVWKNYIKNYTDHTSFSHAKSPVNLMIVVLPYGVAVIQWIRSCQNMLCPHVT